MNSFYRTLEKLVLGDITRTIFVLGLIVTTLVVIGSFLSRKEVHNQKEYYDRHGEPK